MYSLLKSNNARKFIEIFSVFLGLINRIIPKKKNRILIFNSKEVYLNNYALFKYMIDNGYNKSHQIIYSMPNIDETVKYKPHNVKFITGLLKTALYFMTSRVCFLDNSSIRIKPSYNQKVINLWHGTPLKRIGIISKTADKNLPKNQMNAFNYMLVPSEYFREVYKKSFNLSDRQIVINGQPRLDQLFIKRDILSELGISKSTYNKVFMWLTTYRISYDNRLKHTSDVNWSETNLPIIKTLAEAEKLNEYLKAEGVLAIVKIHHGSVFSEEGIKSLSNLLILKDQDFIDKNIQLYEILSQCDALITDYSSVYYDFLLLDRPIIFIIEDIKDYEKNNGFVFNEPLDYMPGKHVNTFEELVLGIKEIVNGQDEYSEFREKINNLANEYKDNLHSKRVLELAEVELTDD